MNLHAPATGPARRVGERVRRVIAVTLLLVATAVVALPAQAAPEDDGFVAQDPSTDFTALPGATVASGIVNPTGPDDWGWRAEIPDDFNGTLVLYAHGFVSPADPRLIVQNPSLRPAFIGGGFGWAASSYSLNGYAIDKPVDETHALIDLFETAFDTTVTQVIIHGVSMGGHVTTVSLERHAGSYDAAYPICGAIGDLDNFTYYQDVNYLTHAEADRTPRTPTPADYLVTDFPPLQQATGVGTTLTPAGHRVGALVEQISGGERPLFEEAWDFWNGTATAVGGFPFLYGLIGGALTGGPDNRLVPTYDNASRTFLYDHVETTAPAVSDLADALTAATATDGATPYFPVTAGTPGVPVLSYHNLGDLFVPLHNEQSYARRVAENGQAGNLVQRVVRSIGHCDFSPGEVLTGFTDLVTWLATGTPPAGDDLLDPDVVADPDFGCTFTVGERAGLPACDAAAQTTRAAGSDRIQTALDVADTAFSAPKTIILARADVYADALAGAALAGVLNAPILLTTADTMDARVAAWITAADPDQVILLGGAGALSDNVLDGAERAAPDATVRRIFGADRFATAAAIGAEVVAISGTTRAFIVKGVDPDPSRGFADGVAVSGLAAHLGQPILLVATDTAPAATRDAITSLGITAVEVIGGTGAVSDSTVAALGVASERLSGASRYHTSAAVLRRAIASGLSLTTPYVATGQGFADALTAGPAAAASGQVFALVNGTSVDGSEPVLAILRTRGITLGVVISGGANAVNAAVEAALEAVVRPD